MKTSIKFNPNREFIKAAIAEYLNQGGIITVQPRDNRRDLTYVGLITQGAKAFEEMDRIISYGVSC